MKTSNAIRKLERAGFEVSSLHQGYWANGSRRIEHKADKGGQRISWIDQGGEVYALHLLDLRLNDAGTYPRSVKAAIESANLAIKQRKDEAPMIARKRRKAEERREKEMASAIPIRFAGI